MTLDEALAEAVSRRKNYAVSRPPIQLDELDKWILDTFEEAIPCTMERPTLKTDKIGNTWVEIDGYEHSPVEGRSYAKLILQACDEAEKANTK